MDSPININIKLNICFQIDFVDCLALIQKNKINIYKTINGGLYNRVCVFDECMGVILHTYDVGVSGGDMVNIEHFKNNGQINLFREDTSR